MRLLCLAFAPGIPVNAAKWRNTLNFLWLKEIFVRLLRARHIVRHFKRLTLLDELDKTDAYKQVPEELTHTLIEASITDAKELLDRLKSRINGLSESEAQAIREKIGLNEVEHEEPLPWWTHLWHCYKNPFNILLTLLAAASYLTGDTRASIMISIMVTLSTFLRFWQESKSSKAADALKAIVSNTATVLRWDKSQLIEEETHTSLLQSLSDTTQLELLISLLVPGDIVVLSAGDMVPADCRVITAKDLFVSQAAMTGESMPVEKFSGASPQNTPKQTNPSDLQNIVFMGTNVVSGTATAVVLSTGGKSYFGALAAYITRNDPSPTSFQVGVNDISWLLIRFMLAMVPLVLLVNGITKGNWIDATIFALSIAVGLTPEMLPMIVTSTLAKGAIFLSRKKVIVKQLDAIQSFGAMDVLCTDKTGTLTQDKIFLARHVDVWGKDSDEVLEMAYLNSYYQTGLKNLLDVAVLEHAESTRSLDASDMFYKVDEIPFDFTRRRMSVVVAKTSEKHLLITKGATEEILSVCTLVRHAQSIEPFTPELLSEIRSVTTALNDEGLRVVAVAAKELSPIQENYGISDEHSLVLIGYVAFLDPPKESTAPALKALSEHGVCVKVLTGDNERVTSKICREVGLIQKGVVLGSDLDQMSEKALSEAVEKYNVFAKLTPIHKERIVRTLKANGHIVGFMGDGINDAPALRSADIGISVDSGVDIAKEAADIILLEKSLMVLEEGVLEGRRTFVNMLKYIKMTTSANFGNVLSVLIAGAFIPFLPMLPIHLLIQNFLYDVSQTAIPFDNVDEESLTKPQRLQPGEIGLFMVFFGSISSIFDITTYAMMWFVFEANTPEKQTLFQSGWFVVGLLTQTLIVHMIRTHKVPFIQSCASPLVLATTAITLAVGIFLPMGPLAPYFKLEALPPLYFLFLPLILFLYMALTQFMKGLYAKHYEQ